MLTPVWGAANVREGGAVDEEHELLTFAERGPTFHNTVDPKQDSEAGIRINGNHRETGRNVAIDLQESGDDLELRGWFRIHASSGWRRYRVNAGACHEAQGDQ